MDVYEFLGMLGYLKQHTRKRNAVNAFWQMGCWAFGKDNIIKAAKSIDEYQDIKEFAR